MKRFIAGILSVAMLFAMLVTTAFADVISPGGDPYLVTGFTDKDGKSVDSYDWNSGNYKVNGSYTKGGSYVGQPYVGDDGCIYIKAKAGSSFSTDKDVTGRITIRDIDNRDTYTAQVSFTVAPPPDMRIIETENKVFILPDSYHGGRVRFRAEDTNATVGTLYAEFVEYGGYDIVAYYKVKLVDQGSLILSNSSDQKMELVKKYDTANLRFIQWNSNPKFETVGTLGIVMNSDEYLYQTKSDGSLAAVSGSYNSDRGTFDFKTDTLGSYVISDKKLSGVGTADTAGTGSSVAPPPASVQPTPPPASSAKPTPPPASSAKPTPPPASSAKPEPPAPSSSSEAAPSASDSSSESSSEAAPSSVPESSEPKKPDSSSTAAKPESDNDEGGFPIVPVAIGAVVIIAGGIAAYFVFKGKGNKKNYDSWDD